MSEKLKIAVVSDTHDKLPPVLLEHLKEADEIWHLGDVSSPRILSQLRSLGIPLFHVKGNMDFETAWPENLELERLGVRFKLQHHPPSSVPPGVNAVLFGHLHYPVDESHEGVRLLNPGAINGPRNNSAASFAWLTIDESGEWAWRIKEL